MLYSGSLRRVALTLLLIGVGGAGLTARLTPGPEAYGASADPPPATAYELPFPCGQTWTGGTRDRHSPSVKAIDFNRDSDAGMPVVAAQAGTATTVRSSTTGYGKYVVLDHGGGESSLYAHLGSLTVAAGQRLDRGAQLGTVGASGNATGTHLHFEERIGGSVTTPWFHGAEFVMGSTVTSQNCVDVPVAGTFTGGRAAGVGVFRRVARAAFRLYRPDTTPLVVRFGTATDQPVVGDWNGDGTTDLGVRTPSTRQFKLRTAAGITTVTLGATADQPVAGDWDGNGRWEVGVRRAGTGIFRLRAANGTVTSVSLGDASDLPVTGDWNGDRRTDLGVFDPATATWTLRTVDDDGIVWTAGVTFGRPGDLPVAGDWDGNGRADLGTWTPASAVFSQRKAAQATATRSTLSTIRFGRARR